MTGAGVTVQIDDLAKLPARVRERLRGAVTDVTAELQASARAQLAGLLNAGPLPERIGAWLHEDAHQITGRVGSGDPIIGFYDQGFAGIEHMSAYIREIGEAFGRDFDTPRRVLVRAYDRAVVSPRLLILEVALLGVAATLVRRVEAAIDAEASA